MDIRFDDPGAVLADNRHHQRRGYVRETISIVMVFGPRGELERAEDLPTQTHRASKRRMLVPQARRLDVGFDANFLRGRTGEALGVRRDPLDPAGYRLDPKLFEAYRSLHDDILAEVHDTSVRAFLRFLAGWSPYEARTVPLLQQRVGAAVAFRFRYDDEFIHEKHAARVAWRRRMTLMGLSPA
jgi:CRISPR-associated protein Csd1